MIELKINEAAEIYQVLGSFIETKLPIKLSYKIAKIISALETDINFYRNNIQKLIQQYGLKNEEGNFIFDENENIKIQPDKIEDFNNEYSELNSMNIEVEEYFLNLSELENLELSPKQIYILEPFVIDDLNIEEEIEGDNIANFMQEDDIVDSDLVNNE